jgi:serine/threonine protein kinase
MKCQKCGNENPEDARFCQSCGTSLAVAADGDLTQVGTAGHEVTIIVNKTNEGDTVISGRFKILKRLGKGGMGEIFLARDVRLGREVAIKSVSDAMMGDSSSKARFLREAQTASQLQHPNICTIYEIYEEGDREYIVMQYVDGITLDQIIKLKKLSVHKVLDIAIQICDGMIEAHAKNVIHRDIKPSNLMVDQKGIVKILDFGLAKFADRSFFKRNGMVDSHLTERGIVMGTVAYMSPEQAKGLEPDQGVDIFSFGVVLYEMLEGRNPFQDSAQIETLFNVVNKEVELSVDIPSELRDIVRKALAKDRKDRYASFSDLKRDLEQFKARLSPKPEARADRNQTEIIRYSEQEDLMREMQQTSDKENLGDMVYRLKKFKASTERILSKSGKRRKFQLVAVPLLAVILVAAAVVLIRHFKGVSRPVAQKENFYIYLNPFKNETREEGLSEQVNYLLTETLNQFNEFKVIDTSVLSSIMGDQSEEAKVAALLDRFNIEYEMEGKLTRYKNIFKIDARLIPFNKKNREYSFTKTGEGKDSFLVHQVDSLARQLYYKSLFTGKDETDVPFISLGKIYGRDWSTFSRFYRGLQFYKRLESARASEYLLQCDDLLAAKYFLADLYHFSGRSREAVEKIEEVMPHIDLLTESLRLRVLALKERLNYNFNGAVLYLEQLQQHFKFSRETYYELGEAYFHHGRAREAVGYYRKAIELDPRYSRAINHLGYCYAYMGDHSRSIQLFEEYRNLDQSANSYDSLGDGYFYAGELTDAESLKKTAVVTDRHSVPWSYLTLTDIYILRAEYERAETALDDYLQVLNTADSRAGVLAKKAFIRYVQEEGNEALETVDQSLAVFDSDDINENTAEAHWIRGLILLSLDRPAEAQPELAWLQAFKDKYKLSKDNFYTPYKYLNHLKALLLEREAKIDEARQTLEYLVGMKTQLSYWITYYNYQFFHTEYARFLSRNREYQAALRAIEECLEFSPNYIPALWLKARLMETLQLPGKETIYRQIDRLMGDASENNKLRRLLRQKISLVGKN